MEKAEKVAQRKVMRNNFWLLKRIWRYTPGYVVWMVVEGIVWGFYHAIEIIYTKELFDALGRHASFERVALIILIFGVYALLFWLFHQWYWQIYNPCIRQKLHVAMHSDMFRQAIRIDLEKYDDPSFYNDFVWAMEKSSVHAEGLMEDTGKLINRIVASLTLTSVLLSVDLTMAVIIFVAAVARIGLTFAYNKNRLQLADQMNLLERKDGYIKRVFKLPDYAKELRITDVAENIFDEHNGNTEKKVNLLYRFGKRFSTIDFMLSTATITAEMIVIIIMLYKVMVTAEVGLGSLAMSVNACWKMGWLLNNLVDRLLKYHEHGIFIEKMIHFMELEPAIKGGNLLTEPFESLVIKDVSFGYPGSDQENLVLSNVSLEVRRGEKIAIVGYNGAGKTTLTKLIMRLYDPVSGKIVYNGRDLKEYAIDSFRQRVAAVFQDYQIFACSVAENIVGGVYDCTDKTRVEAAMEQSVFLDEVQALDSGLDTQLSKEFDDKGVQLSGGEQQKVALARAFYRDADLIILDEPSSALDPDAEYELNKSIYEYSDSRTVIFISHRLSTTRHADRIYMFDSGKLIESGTHEELMSANGKYAYMFNLQAEKYREA